MNNNKKKIKIDTRLQQIKVMRKQERHIKHILDSNTPTTDGNGNNNNNSHNNIHKTCNRILANLKRHLNHLSKRVKSIRNTRSTVDFSHNSSHKRSKKITNNKNNHSHSQ